MPIYDYQCRDCEHVFDALQKLREEPLVDCPACGRPSLRKLLSAPKFRLKGSGWYETDFKTGEKRNIHGEAETKKTDKSADPGSGDKKEKSADKPQKKPASATTGGASDSS